MALVSGTLVERQPEPTAATRRTPRKVELTEENVRRIFGMGLRELFERLAEKFGFQIEE